MWARSFADRAFLREAVEAWDRVVRLAPTSDYATAARKNARSAKDLAHIFAGREG